MRNTPLLVSSLLLVLATTWAAQAVTIVYANDFSGSGSNTAFSNEISNAEWEVTDGVYRNTVVGGGTITSSNASVQVTNAAGTNFVMETQFTVTSLGNVNVGGVQTIGFGLFGADSAFTGNAANPYYLADFAMDGTSVAVPQGQLRILALGDTSGFSNSLQIADDNASSSRAIQLDTTYTLRLTGTFSGGTLNMSLGLYDAAGTTQIGGTTTATDTSPLTGQYFGYRDRYPNGSGTTIVDYDNFSIVPEPGSASLLAISLGLMCLRRFRRGRA